MIVAGWALGLLLMTYYFSGVLEAQHNPNTLEVLDKQDGELVLQRSSGGHYIAEGFINGVAVNFLVDTGASQIAVPTSVARSIGLSNGSAQQIQTASGVTTAHNTVIDEITIGPLRFLELRGLIVPTMEGRDVLLGMNALGRLDIHQRDGVLVLRPPNY